MRKRILQLLAGALIGPALLLGASATWGSTTTQITDNSAADAAAAISGSNLVWQGDDGSYNEIYLWEAAPLPTSRATA